MVVRSRRADLGSVLFPAGRLGRHAATHGVVPCRVDPGRAVGLAAQIRNDGGHVDSFVLLGQVLAVVALRGRARFWAALDGGGCHRFSVRATQLVAMDGARSLHGVLLPVLFDRAKEGIRFQRNGWVLCMLAATLLSSANALYDKHILATLQLDLAAVQAYSAIQRGGMALLLLPWVFGAMECRSLLSRNWAVPAIAAAYILAEFIYLTAVQTEGALISVISVLRRTNLVMVFALSALFFAERFIRQKMLAISGVLVGIVLTIVH